MSVDLREWTILGEVIADRDPGVFEEALGILREIAERAALKRALEMRQEVPDDSLA